MFTARVPLIRLYIFFVGENVLMAGPYHNEIVIVSRNHDHSKKEHTEEVDIQKTSCHFPI